MEQATLVVTLVDRKLDRYLRSKVDELPADWLIVRLPNGSITTVTRAQWFLGGGSGNV